MHRARDNVLARMDFPWSAARIRLSFSLRTAAGAVCLCAYIILKSIGIFGCRFVRPREAYGRCRRFFDDELTSYTLLALTCCGAIPRAARVISHSAYGTAAGWGSRRHSRFWWD